LHKAPAPPVMVEYLRPVGILTSNSPPPTLSRPTSALGQSRDNSQDGHVTKIKIQDNEKEADSKSLRGMNSHHLGIIYYVNFLGRLGSNGFQLK
jgi:hypothetical protein